MKIQEKRHEGHLDEEDVKDSHMETHDASLDEDMKTKKEHEEEQVIVDVFPFQRPQQCMQIIRMNMTAR